MDIEETFNLTNKQKHPTNVMIVVYRHTNSATAETFSMLLVDADIDFEVQIDEEDEKKPTYFGIRKKYEKEVDRLNYIAIGKHRERFISSAPVRWLFIVISLSVLLLAVIGAILSK